MRLNEADRDKVMTDTFGHYEEVLVAHPGWEIEPGFGLVQLRALGDEYLAKVAAIDAILQTGMPAKRAQRDALFGLSAADTDGIWIYLSLYKGAARLQLQRFAPRALAKSLGSTTPNVGNVTPGAYDAILRRFIEHWTLVNGALPAANPLVVGPFALADVEARRAQIAELAEAVDETVLTRLAVLRAEREQMFGDVREDERESDSMVARLEAYRIGILTQFAGSPLAQTVPRIFPADTGETLPRVPFNFRQNAGDVTVWFAPPQDVTASVVYLKEGAFEETLAIPAVAPFKVTFSGVTVQEDVDDVELRDENGKTVAHGKFDASLIEPV